MLKLLQEAAQTDLCPGNIRELLNVIQFTSMKCSGTTITPEHLPQYVSHGTGGNAERVCARKQSMLTKEKVLTALASSRGNKVKAAKELGVGRATFYRFINKAGMNGAGVTAGAGAP